MEERGLCVKWAWSCVVVYLVPRREGVGGEADILVFVP